MDKLDRHILSILQEDSRTPNKEIAARINLTPSATSERLKRLRQSGYIKKFEARLNDQELGFGLVAFVFVRTNEMAGSKCIGDKLVQIPEALEVYNIAGEDCYLVKVRTRDTESLSRILREKIGTIDEVTSTRTTIVMESFKESLALPLTTSNGNHNEK